MRVVVAGQARTGNQWLKYLLAHVYGLQVLADVPAADVASLQTFISHDRFPDNAIFHQHFWPSDQLLTLARTVPFALVTPLRDPYDAFVSLYFLVQKHRRHFEDAGDRAWVMIDKPLDHPDVLTFLERDYRQYLELSLAWASTPSTILTRYEDLHRDPIGELRKIMNRLEPVEPDRIEKAVAATRPEVLLRQDGWWSIEIRVATVGDWSNHLTEQHLRILRDAHGDLIREIGYPVR